MSIVITEAQFKRHKRFIKNFQRGRVTNPVFLNESAAQRLIDECADDCETDGNEVPYSEGNPEPGSKYLDDFLKVMPDLDLFSSDEEELFKEIDDKNIRKRKEPKLEESASENNAISTHQVNVDDEDEEDIDEEDEEDIDEEDEEDIDEEDEEDIDEEDEGNEFNTEGDKEGEVSYGQKRKNDEGQDD